MKVKDILKIQEVIEKRKTPCDVEENDYKYYSESKDKEINLLDMHIVHLLRAFKNRGGKIIII